MELRELLEKIDELLQLDEFAIPRRIMIRKIQDYAEAIMDHVCKIKYAGKLLPDTIHHWNSEIQSKVNQILAQSFKGGHLKENQLRKWLMDFLDNEQELNDRRKLVANQEKISIDKLKSVDKEDFNDIKTYINELTKLIVKQTTQSIRYIELEEIEKLSSLLISY